MIMIMAIRVIYSHYSEGRVVQAGRDAESMGQRGNPSSNCDGGLGYIYHCIARKSR
jgi:hypothetical protein